MARAILQLMVFLAAGCQRGPGDAQTESAEAGKPVLVEVALESGIDFRHINGASGRYYYVETYGSGAAFLD